MISFKFRSSSHSLILPKCLFGKYSGQQATISGCLDLLIVQMSGRQMHSTRHNLLPRTNLNVLIIPSVVIGNANKEIMLPATIAISRGFPAVDNSNAEEILTRCLIILGTGGN